MPDVKLVDGQFWVFASARQRRAAGAVEPAASSEDELGVATRGGTAELRQKQQARTCQLSMQPHI